MTLSNFGCGFGRRPLEARHHPIRGRTAEVKHSSPSHYTISNHTHDHSPARRMTSPLTVPLLEVVLLTVGSPPAEPHISLTLTIVDPKNRSVVQRCIEGNGHDKVSTAR